MTTAIALHSVSSVTIATAAAECNNSIRFREYSKDHSQGERSEKSIEVHCELLSWLTVGLLDFNFLVSFKLLAIFSSASNNVPRTESIDNLVSVVRGRGLCISVINCQTSHGSQNGPQRCYVYRALSGLLDFSDFWRVVGKTMVIIVQDSVPGLRGGIDLLHMVIFRRLIHGGLDYTYYMWTSWIRNPSLSHHYSCNRCKFKWFSDSSPKLQLSEQRFWHFEF